MNKYTNSCFELSGDYNIQQIWKSIGKILETSLIPIFIYDLYSLKHVYANNGAQDFLGYSFEELKTLSFLDHSSEFSSIDEVKKALNHLFSEKKDKVFYETTLKHKDGTLRLVEIEFVIDEPKDKQYLILFVKCLKDRKQIQEIIESANNEINEQVEKRTRIIEEKKAHLYAIFDNLPFMAWLKDKQGSYINVNQPFSDACGLPISEVIGKTDFDIWGEAIAKSNYNDDFEVIKAKKSKAEEISYFVDDEEIFIERFKTPIKNEKGEIIGTTGISRDISERKRMERELLRSKEVAECASKTKSEFLAMMSHEIRTPINCIVGFLQLLGHTQLQLTQKEYLKKIKISSNMLLTLINDILDFSKIEAGKLDIENLKFDLHSVIEESLVASSMAAGSKQLELNCLIHSQLPKFVEGDSARLKQILNNLISNAIKFTSKGNICVEARLKEQKNENALIEISVKDTGIGVSPETIKTIFDPFIQADLSTTRKYGGTGLGLSITKKLVEMMGGSINIDSSENGTDVNFTLNVKLLSSTIKVLNCIESTNVLVIENEDATIKTIESYLKEINCNVESVKTFEQGVRFLKNNKKTNFLIINYQILSKNHDFISYLINFNEKLSNLYILSIISNFKSPDKIMGEKNFLGYLHNPIKKEILQNYIVNAIPILDSIPQNQGLSGEIIMDGEYKKFNKCKLLIAEDNEINIQLAEEMLKHLCCNFEVARDGQEALNLCSTNNYDLILMDCQMPVMDGYEASKNIKNLDGYKNVPIIAVTAYALEDDMKKCLNAGMDDYISKPVDLKILQSKLEKYLLNQA